VWRGLACSRENQPERVDMVRGEKALTAGALISQKREKQARRVCSTRLLKIRSKKKKPKNNKK